MYGGGYSAAAGLMQEALSDDPFVGVPKLLETFTTRWRQLATGAPGMGRVVMPVPERDRQVLREMIMLLVDKTAARSLEVGSLAARERYIRYWRVFCDLLGVGVVMRGPEEAWILSGFAAVLGVVWRPARRGAGERSGLGHSTVSAAISQVRAWHFEEHCIDVKGFEARATRVVRGLKKMTGPRKPLLHLPVEAYRFIVLRLLRQGDPLSRAIAHAISWMFLALFRVSEIAATNQHHGANARHLLHKHVTVLRATSVVAITRGGGAGGNGVVEVRRARKVEWTLPKTKWKDMQMSRHLYVKGCGEKEEEDVTDMDLVNDFANTMAGIHEDNEEWLRGHPEYTRDLPFIHVNGEALTRGQIHAAIDEGLRAGQNQGLPNPDSYTVGTHTCRRGGATHYAECGVGDKMLCWLGRWASVAWLHYVRITPRAVSLVSGLVW